MRTLPTELRGQLEAAVVDARRRAEIGARAALSFLGVGERDRPSHLSEEQARLRRGLRAKQRQLGGGFNLLIWECAYEQWHRLLFARFLAENGLLRHPEFGVPVTLEECAELAGDLGEPDGWCVAARFAAEILPGIFRLDDPCVQLRLAPEHRVALERIIADLPGEVFVADDSLGWVYQYWQKERKDQVNASEAKIGGADIAPVTQLFTENYMVRFLLENSLGAWWATRHPESPLVKEFDYLRVDEDGRPAAGGFDGWPDRVAEVTVMDPYCGSGHFLVEAFGILWRLRVEEEGLDPIAAQDAVLKDNLFGLDLDPRCVQIAMFALGLTAWKHGGGWRELSVPNLACSGIPAKGQLEDWTALAEGDYRLERTLERLHALFADAELLGSLIDPRYVAEMQHAAGFQQSLDNAAWDEVGPVLAQVAAGRKADIATAVLGADASGLSRAADLLTREYTLQVTNVPYLARRNQAASLASWCTNRYPAAAPNLGTACIARMFDLGQLRGTIAVVSPQNWLFQVSYKNFRYDLFSNYQFCCVARLGPGSFETITGEVVNVHMAIMQIRRPRDRHMIPALDLTGEATPSSKATALSIRPFTRVPQAAILKQQAARFAVGTEAQPLLGDFAQARQGDATGDDPRLKRQFWELPRILDGWRRLQSSPSGLATFSGCSGIIDVGAIDAGEAPGSVVRARDFRGRRGVVVRQTRPHYPALHTGVDFDMSAPVLFPKEPELLPAIWAFVRSASFPLLVAQLDPDRKVPNKTFEEVPFGADHWRRIAEAEYPKGLPEPCSDDPTQWLFGGRPEASAEPLQVAVGRLLGYRWPEQPESDDLHHLIDLDGIACLPVVKGERSAADRLQELLARAYSDEWSPGLVRRLLSQTGSEKETLAEWMRDEFFGQHCKLFGQRPFVWHIWDGRKDGFSALVNYHKLDRAGLERLIYTYLGDWIERQRADVTQEIVGADLRLAAAQDLRRNLETVLEGEPPYDIYVRWKPLHRQPVGWEPDLNDGVRVNIRPFVEARVLRSKVGVHWRKDRGKNPDGSERHNDLHFTRAQKQQARREAGVE